MKSSQRWPGPGLVLVAPAGVSAAADQALAQLLQLECLPPLQDPQVDPATALAALAQRSGPAAWLQPLALDPGAWLGPGRGWADALGAWRQPTLLVVPGAAAGSGPAAAYRALLAMAGVPLVGLVQWGGAWLPGERRSDGLPWLGWLPAAEEEAQETDWAALRHHCLVSWQALAVPQLGQG
jgi:hypothetical protein